MRSFVRKMEECEFNTSRGDNAVAGTDIEQTVREKREAIVSIAAKHGATQVRLIGSVARGEARPDSDIDLLVTCREGTSLLDQASLMLELENLLGRKVDIASDGWVKASLRESAYRGFQTFLGDEMLQVCVIHHLQMLGEAGRCMSQSLRDNHPEVPWPQIIALSDTRSVNSLSHYCPAKSFSSGITPGES
jgi:predicted nucleotidyltransferase